MPQIFGEFGWFGSKHQVLPHVEPDVILGQIEARHGPTGLRAEPFGDPDGRSTPLLRTLVVIPLQHKAAAESVGDLERPAADNARINSNCWPVTET